MPDRLHFFLTFQDSFKIIILKSVPKQLFFLLKIIIFASKWLITFNMNYTLYRKVWN